MKLSIGFDERNTVITQTIQWLTEQGHQLSVYGPQQEGSAEPWPTVARQVAEDVVAQRSAEGILFCWTGTGVSLAANKVPGIRAALCADAETARGARLWNNANIICLSARLTSEALAQEILKSWFSHSYQPNPTDDACLEQVKNLEDKYGR